VKRSFFLCSLCTLAFLPGPLAFAQDNNPPPVIPKATTDLLVAQRGPKVLLSWGYPSLTTAGKSMNRVGASICCILFCSGDDVTALYSDMPFKGEPTSQYNLDPKLASPPTDESLASGSPAIGAGVAIAGVEGTFDGKCPAVPPNIGAY
jgi:hypothetical protein